MNFAKKEKDAIFDSVAARVETEVGSPAALLVTSALAIDGTTMIAGRLAEAFVNVGYRVAVVDARESAGGDIDVRRPGAGSYGGELGESSRGYAELSLRDLGERFAGSRRDVAALVARLRTRYDYVIVNAPAFAGPMPVLFADACDAIMVGVQRGRSATAEDKQLNSYLDGSEKHALGIIGTTKAAIANFAATAHQRSRITVPPHDVVDDRSARVSVITGAG